MKYGSKIKTVPANRLKMMIKVMHRTVLNCVISVDQCRLCHRHKYSADVPKLWEAMFKKLAISYAS